MSSLAADRTSSSVALDVSSIASITNPAEVVKLLNDVIHEERTVDGQLEEMLQRHSAFEDMLRSVINETEEVLDVSFASVDQ